MAKAVIEERITTGHPNIEVVRLEASDTNTFQSEKFRLIHGGIVCMNHQTSDVAVNIEDDDSSAINSTQDGVILNLNGITSKTCSLLLLGRRS